MYIQMAYKKIGKKSPIVAFRSRKGKGKSGGYKTNTNRRRIPRSVVPNITNKHYAQITETVELSPIEGNTNYTEVFQLSQFTRALRISENFKFYRAKQVLYKYEPAYNLFSEGGETIPLAYMVMNRTQERGQLYDVGQLEEQGALPRKFTSQITMKYMPNWCTSGLIALKKDLSGNVTDVIQQGVQKCYKYLMTPTDSLSQFRQSEFIETNGLTTQGYTMASNPAAQVIYNGHLVHFSQTNEGTSKVLARRTVTVVWEFRGPKTRNTASTVPEIHL